MGMNPKPRRKVQQNLEGLWERQKARQEARDRARQAYLRCIATDLPVGAQLKRGEQGSKVCGCGCQSGSGRFLR